MSVSGAQSFVDDFTSKVQELNIKEMLKKHVHGKTVHSADMSEMQIFICGSPSCINLVLPEQRSIWKTRIRFCDFCEETYCNECNKDMKFIRCNR
jgi:hypothetical protein